MTKITVSQTRQIQNYEPRKIEIEIEIDDNEDWTMIARDAVNKINYLLYPEKHEDTTTPIPF